MFDRTVDFSRRMHLPFQNILKTVTCNIKFEIRFSSLQDLYLGKPNTSEFEGETTI